MEDIYKTLPIALTAFFGAGALIFTAAKATPEEAQRVKIWVTQIVLLLWLAAAFSWSSYHCIEFASSGAPITRPEVVLFGMHLVNAATYMAAFVFELRKSSKAKRKTEVAAFEEKRAKMEEDLLEARIQANVAEQLARFAQLLNGGPVQTDKDSK